MTNGCYLKITYKGPKPTDTFETQPKFEIVLKNADMDNVLDTLERTKKILGGGALSS